MSAGALAKAELRYTLSRAPTDNLAIGDLGQYLRKDPILSGARMKAYIVTSGIIFALIAVAHVLRVLAEGTRLIAEPFFILMTLAAIGMALWAWRVVPSPGR
jgi:hypothetical protein